MNEINPKYENKTVKKNPQKVYNKLKRSWNKQWKQNIPENDKQKVLQKMYLFSQCSK
jgi:hypothetical protein